MIDAQYDGKLIEGLAAMADAALNRQQEADYLAGNMLKRDPWEIVTRAKLLLTQQEMGAADVWAFWMLGTIQDNLCKVG